jgi:hypothetical protein
MTPICSGLLDGVVGAGGSRFDALKDAVSLLVSRRNPECSAACTFTYYHPMGKHPGAYSHETPEGQPGLSHWVTELPATYHDASKAINRRVDRAFGALLKGY